uniref:Uncharacterized protein n=1 Tax=Anguilla anguilla TaxID=7936 RepID=A0A0E9QJQ2_ANGAN
MHNFRHLLNQQNNLMTSLAPYIQSETIVFHSRV